MRSKFFKSLIFVFILMLCSAIYLGVKIYGKNTQTFKTFGKIGAVSMIESSGYNELKCSIDQKYTQKFVKILNDTSCELKTSIEAVLGDDYKSLKTEYDEIFETISKEIKNFKNGEEYIALKDKLSSLKEKIDALDKSAKDEYLDEFRRVLNEISTLNTKFNNGLKSKRERLDEIKSEVKEMFVVNKDKLISVRRSNMDKTRELIKDMLLSYRIEINELNDAFDVKPKCPDYPFDISSMQDCLVAGKLETECFNEILDMGGEKQVIYSENTSKIIS